MSGASGQFPAIVGIGESLFDVFEDRTVLGGAPLNFAVHAHDLLTPGGGSAAVVSRVGRDPLGERLLAGLHERGAPVEWMQHDERHATGRSLVTIGPSGDAGYEIIRDVAWDFIAFDERFEQLAGATRLVCFNTLGQRSPVSRQTIQRFVAACGGMKLFDVNLRQEFYDRDLIEACFASATHAKLNLDEMKIIGRLLGLDDGGEIDTIARRLINRFNLAMVALTQGATGTALFTATERVQGQPVNYPPRPGADTVGAGDACCAGLAVGLVLGWRLDRVVGLANHCGAYVASCPGATPRLPRALLQAYALA